MFGDDASIGDTAAGIHGSIGKTNGRNRPGDVFKLQTLLHKLGYRDAAGTDGPTGYLGSFDHEPVMAFQRDHGLKPDGMLEPGGETIRALQNFAQQPDIAGGPASAVVQVRAYQQTRDGKTVQVAAHERGGPGGEGLNRPKNERASRSYNKATATYGETRGLYPKAKADSKKNIYNPNSWDEKSSNELQTARAWVAVVSERNNVINRIQSPTVEKDKIEQKAWEDSLSAAQKSEALAVPEDVEFFFIRQEKVGKQRPGFLPTDQQPYKSFGPFRNVGGGDVPKGDATYIDFYQRRR
ncbi:peptidoglycan-binding protein [Ferrovibrio sp.]|uniref:peptidoglycan-binding domain-containing protein n=1 Tax=Ferrovibrio sp. TaxID=1917215 RepID=UPI0035B3CDB4